ncbi:MAG: LysE family translocator [Rhodospirillales bacterium]|nr:LysE family translocator [Rhodospirillales bacterium]
MTLATTLALALAVFVLAATPGPAVFAMIARALASGFGPATMFILGVLFGDVALLLLALFGMAAVAEAMGDLFVIVKIAGGAYLIWLGWTLWRADPDLPNIAGAAPAPANQRPLRPVLDGFVLTLGNPKAIIFYAAFLPTFVDIRAITPGDMLIVVAVVVVVLAAVSIAYVGLAARARKLIRSRRARLTLNRTAGTLMVGAGIVVATR